MTKAIKGFDHDFTCLGFQYEVGKTYEHEGIVRMCETGFHACPTDIPFAVWDYYPPVSNNGDLRRYAEVTLGDTSQEGNKLVSALLTVDVELTLPEFMQRSIDALKALAKGSTTGEWAHAATTGEWAHAATTGNDAHAATTGNDAHAATTGYEAHAVTTGYDARAATTGNWAHAATTGEWAHAAATGYEAHAATTGNRAHAATTGYAAHAATTGNRAHAATTGNQARAATTGKQSTAMAAGINSRVKARSGGLFAQEWRDGEIISNACGIVGQNGIKPDTWYICKDNKLVEVE